jgi:hypothetical protein
MRAGRQRPTWRRTQLRLHRIAHRRDVIRPGSAESNWFDAVDSSRMDHRAMGSGGARRDGSPADNMGVNLFVAQKRLPDWSAATPAGRTSSSTRLCRQGDIRCPPMDLRRCAGVHTAFRQT